MSEDLQAVQIELRLPYEIRAALTRRAVVYLPLGTIEWHCEHLPVGLDALTAHGLCLRAAARDGGLVCPPLYYGTGGGHAAYPFTIMMDDETEIRRLLLKSLERFQDFGFRLAVLFSGHFAPLQLSMIKGIEMEWNAGGSAMKILAVGVNEGKDIPIAPDHAAIFETTLLYALWPDRVQLSRLHPLEDSVDPDRGLDPFGPQRHDERHPLYGVLGPDPRKLDTSLAPHLLNLLVDWLVNEVRRKL